jgi:hypothetical protein
MDVIDRQLALAHEFAEIEIERRGVYDQLVPGFFESNENARFLVVSDPVDQELDTEHRLAAACAAANKRRASARESAKRYLVETSDAGRRLFQTLDRASRRPGLLLFGKP